MESGIIDAVAKGVERVGIPAGLIFAGLYLLTPFADDVPARYLGNDSLVFEVLVLIGRYLLGKGRPGLLEWTVMRAPGEPQHLIFTVGTYRTLACAFNTFGIQLDNPTAHETR